MTLLHLDQVGLHLPEMAKPILTNINYHVQAGDFIILLGSNGSGKSTLLKLLYRQYTASTGHIDLFDKPIAAHSSAEFSQKVAVLTQNCHESLFSSLSIYENYLLIKPKLRRFARVSPREERAFLAGYLHDYNQKLGLHLDTPVEQLSGGEKQALALAFCLLQPPALLLLDEHTSALDPKTSNLIMQLTSQKIHEHGITCILTTHDLDIALRYGNRVLMLRDGEIHQAFDHGEKAPLRKETLMAHYY